MSFTEACRPGTGPSAPAGRVLCVTLCTAAALTGCGTPPPPPLSSPPQASASLDGSPAAGASGPAGLPPPAGPPTAGSYGAALPPTGGVPQLTYPQPTYPAPTYAPPTYPPPTYAPPTYPPPRTATVPPTTTAPTTPAVRPASRCRGGPTAEQVLAKVRNQPGVPPDAQLKVTDGPFCAGQWQYSAVGLVTDPGAEPLQVVTRGLPTALELLEAGGDVCSERVQAGAPPGIRVRACGA